MALTTPILNSVPAWDVANGQIFTFNVIGGDQVVGNILYIKDNTSGQVVYTQNTTSYQYQAVVPVNASDLTNGTYYSAYVVTKNNANQTSQPSNIIQFYCYTTPSFTIDITDNETITTSAISPTLTYSQLEDEPLNDYTFILYNSSRNQISSSGVKYSDSDSGSYSANYSFLGLTDGETYFIRVTGHTVEGTVLDTGYIRFTVSYIQQETYNILSLQNNCQVGYIVYYSNAFSIIGTATEYAVLQTTTYLGERSLVLFRIVDGQILNATATWDSGVAIENDFTFRAWYMVPEVIREINSLDYAEMDLVVLQNQDNGDIIKIKNVWDYSDTGNYTWLEAIVNDSYFVLSNEMPIPVSDDDLYVMELQRVGNLYNLELRRIEQGG